MQRLGPGGEGGVEEGPHRISVGGLEGDVGLAEAVARLLSPDPELGRRRDAVADGVVGLHGAPTSEGRQDGVVEAGAGLHVGALDGDVGEHEPSLPGADRSNLRR